MTLIHYIAVSILAQLLIYIGLTFMAGKLFPGLLMPIYHLVPSSNYRVLCATLTVMMVGNYFFQRLYSLQPVLTAGIISTVTGVLIVNAGGLIIEQKLPSLLMGIGVIALLTGAVVCVYARGRL